MNTISGATSSAIWMVDPTVIVITRPIRLLPCKIDGGRLFRDVAHDGEHDDPEEKLGQVPAFRRGFASAPLIEFRLYRRENRGQQQHTDGQRSADQPRAGRLPPTSVDGKNVAVRDERVDQVRRRKRQSGSAATPTLKLVVAASTILRRPRRVPDGVVEQRRQQQRNHAQDQHRRQHAGAFFFEGLLSRAVDAAGDDGEPQAEQAIADERAGDLRFRTTSGSPARRMKMARISSGALPNVTLSNPPMALPTLCEISSVPMRM